MRTLSIVGGAVVILNDYKAPHAYQGTPARLYYKRTNKFKLFKGHRP